MDLDSRQKRVDLDLDSRQRDGFGFGFEVIEFAHHWSVGSGRNLTPTCKLEFQWLEYLQMTPIGVPGGSTVQPKCIHQADIDIPSYCITGNIRVQEIFANIARFAKSSCTRIFAQNSQNFPVAKLPMGNFPVIQYPQLV